ncbi:MAG: LolA family protein [Vulcanimicrobiaceae bacterium]
MKSLVAFCCLAVTLVLAAPPAAESQAPPVADPQPAPLNPAGNDLLKRMTALNANLHSYKAAVHLDVALKTFPYLSPSIDGSVYYKQPDKQAVVFDTVPALASQFKKVYPKVDPPGIWTVVYEVGMMGDQSGTTTFRLVPKKNGRIEHLDVQVDDATATAKSYTWSYKDGGYVTFDQTYKNVAGNYLVDKQTGHVELPSYKADVTSAFSNYQLNVVIADSVFEQ